MLYQELTRRKPRNHDRFVQAELHYFDSAQELRHLQVQGYTRADMARMTNLTVPVVNDRLRLSNLDEGLQTYLRQSGAPECIAVLLLALPDPVTRRRIAARIVRERLCIRDAGLLVCAALHRQRAAPKELCRQHVIVALRDVRPFRNAIRDIAEQMKTAGVRASFTERRAGGMQELTVAYPVRRRRTERYHAM